MRRIQIIFIALLALLDVANAQNQTITGQVLDLQNKQPIKGVQVLIVGKSDATTTDFQGKYLIKVAQADTLEFSINGYKSKKVAVKNRKVINVELAIDDKVLEEVIVTRNNGIVFKKAVATGAIMTRGGVISTYAPRVYQQSESYGEITENGFISPVKEPLSTFAADVDAASYGNIRRMINAGNIPTKDAVRVEELINYFQYDLKAPSNGDPVNIYTELGKAPWNTENKLIRIALKAKNVPTKDLPYSNFVFLIDVSGSMNGPNRLPLVQSSLKLLVDQLRDKDRVAIVTYAGNASIKLESTPGNQKMKIKDAIDELRASGSTAGGAGIKLAYQIARNNFVKGGNNRVILATDGDFNVGASSDRDMEDLISKERESGVNLTVLGFGMGNLKDSKMELLADKGRGNYAYIDNISEARKAIVTEFGGTLFTVAKDVKIQVEFNPAYVRAYRLIGYENRLLEASDFNNDAKLGGDMGVGHTVTALYEIVPVGIKSSIIGDVDPLKYQSEDNRAKGKLNGELATVKFRYKDPDGSKSKLQQVIIKNQVKEANLLSDDFRFASSVAEFGMLIRNSEFKQNANYKSLIARARSAKGEDYEGYRAEFIRLAENAMVIDKR